MRDSAPFLEAGDVERMRSQSRRETYSNDHFKMDLVPVGQGDAQATEATHRRALERSAFSLLYDLELRRRTFADIPPDVLP